MNVIEHLAKARADDRAALEALHDDTEASRRTPPDNHDSLVYLDAACTQLTAVHQASRPTFALYAVSSVAPETFVVAYRVGAPCAPAPLDAVIRRPSPGCVPRKELVALGSRYEGEVFHLDGAQCVAAGDTGLEYHEPGAPLDPGAYGALTERTE